MESASDCLCIELSPSRLTAIVFSKGKESWQVRRFAADNAGGAAAAQTLKKATGSPETRDFRVALSLWSPGAIVRRVTLPVLTASELRTAIRFEAEKHIPFPIEECAFDQVVLHRSDDKKQMELLLVAVKKEAVTQGLSHLKEAGLEPDFIDIHPFALANAFEALEGPEKSNGAALVYIGRADGFCFGGENFVHILRGSEPWVVRDLGRDTVRGEGHFLPEAMERLALGVKDSVDFYENSLDETVSAIHLAGEGAAVPDLLKAMGDILERPAQIWDPTPRLEWGGPEAKDTAGWNPHQAGVCLGLAVRALGK